MSAVLDDLGEHAASEQCPATVRDVVTGRMKHELRQRPGVGLESGVDGYDDSTALVAGRWGADQWAQATVYTANQNDKISQEVELRPWVENF